MYGLAEELPASSRGFLNIFKHGTTIDQGATQRALITLM